MGSLALVFLQDSGINAPGSVARGHLPLLFSCENVQGRPQGTPGRDSPFLLRTEESWGGDAAALACQKVQHLQASSEAITAGSSAHWEAQGAGTPC